MTTLRLLVVALALGLSGPAASANPSIESLAAPLDAKVQTWRRDFHQHPELGNRETRTSGIVAAHLRALGLEVRTGIAHTGVVGILRGGLPGPNIALRADIDALPVTERGDPPRGVAIDVARAIDVPEECAIGARDDNGVGVLPGVDRRVRVPDVGAVVSDDRAPRTARRPDHLVPPPPIEGSEPVIVGGGAGMAAFGAPGLAGAAGLAGAPASAAPWSPWAAATSAIAS